RHVLLVCAKGSCLRGSSGDKPDGLATPCSADGAPEPTSRLIAWPTSGYSAKPRERCPSGLRSATGNRVRAERCVAGSNPALSAQHGGNQVSPVGLRPRALRRERCPASARPRAL